MWGEDNKQQPLQITAADVNGMSTFAIAVVRGHLEMARVILDIAQAQYKVVETKKEERYEIDDASDNGESDDDVRIISEPVNEQFTVDDIGALDFDAGSTDSPSDVIGRSYRLTIFLQDTLGSGFKRKQRFYYDLFEYAIRTDNVPVLTFLLEMGQLYQKRNEVTESRIFTLDESLVYMAIQYGRLRCLEEIITRTGGDLPLNELAEKSGVQVHEKPKYYQGLSIRGRKRADWAAAGRATQQRGTEQVSPLLVSARFGCLKSVEWFWSTAPARHYLSFTKNHPDDKRLKLLAQSRKGVEGSINSWLNTRSMYPQLKAPVRADILGHLVLHCAVMSNETAESMELIQYIITLHPEYMEVKSATGYTPLALAYSLHRIGFAELLIKGGANQTIRDGKGNNLIHLMLCGFDDIVLGNPSSIHQLLNLLDNRLVESMLTERSSDSPGSLSPLARWMHKAIPQRYYPGRSYDQNTETASHVEIARHLLDAAASSGQKHLEMLDGTGNTPIHDAVKRQLPCIFELMITRRPDLLHRESSTGTTPLELAVDAWVTEATANPPFLPTNNKDSYWSGREDRQWSVAIRRPESFVQKPKEKSERKTIMDMSRARASAIGGSEKRKLVSLNEANEVAKRLAVQSEAKTQASRMQLRTATDEEDELLKSDEITKWYERASRGVSEFSLD